MSERFQLGDRVAWPKRTRPALFNRDEHVGAVVAVLPAGQGVYADVIPAEYQTAKLQTEGWPRDHESYLVYEPSASGLGKGRLYWPHVSQLRRVK